MSSIIGATITFVINLGLEIRLSNVGMVAIVASLRQRNRLNAMRHTQRTALPLFIDRGFDQVTVGEIAAAAGMAPSTLYRHFRTKEDIVLWDEHDAAIDESLSRHLRSKPPFLAIRNAFVESIGGRYDADIDFQLTRIKYIFATEQIHAAAVEADFQARSELTEALTKVLSTANSYAAPIIAGAALLALDAALDAWQRADGETTLGDEIAAAFDTLARIASVT